MADVPSLFRRYGPGYRWVATVTVMAGTMGIVLSSTIVNVAIPEVMGTFGVGQDQAQWIATAFLAAMTVSQLVTAWAVAAFGIRTAYLICLVLFIAGAALGGTAANMESLALGRLLQGTAAGVVMPISMIVIALVFPPERKGFAMGIFGMGTVLAPSIGPVVGGIAIDNYNWRYIFAIPMPLCALAILLGSHFLPTRDTRTPRARLDWAGLVLLTVSIVCLLTLLARGQRAGWFSDDVLVRLGIGLGAAYGFVALQLRSDAPLLDFAVLRNQQFASACLIAFVFGAGLFATTYYIPVFVQTVMSYTATQAGLLLAPGGLILMVVFPLAGRLADSLPAHYLIIGGLTVLSYGFLLLAGADVNTAFVTLVAMTLVGRLGLGFILPPLNAAALRALPAEHLTRGSGTISFFRQLGGAFGVSALVITVEQRSQIHSAALSATQTADNQTSRELLGAVTRLLGEAGVPEYAQAGGALQFLGRMVHAQAASLAFQDAALIISATFLLSVLPAILLARSRPSPVLR